MCIKECNSCSGTNSYNEPDDLLLYKKSFTIKNNFMDDPETSSSLQLIVQIIVIQESLGEISTGIANSLNHSLRVQVNETPL